jgi:hypothetical protein
MMQVEARPAIGEAVRAAGASRRPIRIVAPTVSGRRWRTASRVGEPRRDALAIELGRNDLAAFLSACAPR